MSVESAADRSAQDEAIRAQRDQYKQSEAESAKRNAKKIQTMSESHQAELEKLKGEHTKQIQELTDRTRETLNRRDMHYQHEISEMRDLHTKQIQRQAAEAEMHQTETEKALKGELHHLQATSAEQRDIERTNYMDQMKLKDKAFEEYAQTSRANQKQATGDIKKRMNEAHHKEVGMLAKDRDQRIAHEKREQMELRRVKEHQYKTLEESKNKEVQRVRDAGSIERENMVEQRQDNEQNLREGFEQGLRRYRDRFEQAAEEVRNENESARNALSKTVNDRLDDRVRALEVENKKLKDDVPRVAVRSGQQKARELENLRDAMGANIRELERDRIESLDAMNAKTKQEITKVNEKSEGLLGRTNKFYQEKMAMEDLRNEERFGRAETDFARQLGQEKVHGEARVDNLLAASEREESKMRAFFDRSSMVMKENFDATLRELRDKNKRDQEAMFAHFTKESQEADVKAQQRVAEITGRYERQIAEMQEKHLKTMKEQQTLAARGKKEAEKKGQMDVSTVTAQYENRIAKMDEAHKREIDQVHRKHEETLANLTKNRQA